MKKGLAPSSGCSFRYPGNAGVTQEGRNGTAHCIDSISFKSGSLLPRAEHLFIIPCQLPEKVYGEVMPMGTQQNVTHLVTPQIRP